MTVHITSDEKLFPIPGFPLEVKLSIHREQPPIVQVKMYGPKRIEHKEPRHAAIINRLFDEIKNCATTSGLFPANGRIIVDPYASEDMSLDFRYPSPAPAYAATSLVDSLIRDPIDTSQRRKKNVKNSAALFTLLEEKILGFINALEVTLKNKQATREKKAPSQAQSAPMDQETSDAYHLFGATPDTSWEEIKKSYHDKARHAHPDVKGGADDGSFHILKEAYELLKKKHRKK